MPAVPASSRLVLLTGPAGSGKTHRALERIREAATTPGERGRGAGAPGVALLVLPTYAQAMHVRRVALSRWDARAILDDPFVTFTSAGERFLDAFRVRALPSAEERDRLMAHAVEEAAVVAFEAVGRSPGFRARLLRLVKEVKQSGLAPSEAALRLRGALDGLRDDARERLDGFLAVFDRYEDLLDRAGLEDHEDTLRRLGEQLRLNPPARPPRTLVVDGFDDFTPVEQQILDGLSDVVVAAGGEVMVTLPWDERRSRLFALSAAARSHLLGRGFVEQGLSGFPRCPGGTLERIATCLFGPWEGGGEAAGPDETVRLVVAGDPEDEAEAIAREARRLDREGGILRSWRDLGVVVRRLDDVAGRLEAAFARLDVPCRVVGAGRPLAAEGLVRALVGPLGVLGGDADAFDASALTTWLAWRARARADAQEGRRVDALEIRGRRKGFPSDWAAWLEEVGAQDLDVGDLTRHRDLLGVAHGAEEVYAALERALLDLAPLPPSGGLDETGRPIDTAADHHRARGLASRDRLLGIVRGLARAAALTGLGADVGAREGVLALGDAILHTCLVLPDRRLDAVSLIDAEEARFWDLPVVFVAGLAQGSFPLHPREDVLLRDEERESIRRADDGLALPLARDRETRERRLFYGAVTRARRRLVLFRPGCSEGGDVRSASLYLRDLERVVSLETTAVRRSLGRSAPKRLECFTRRDWALFAAATARDAKAEASDRDLARALLERGETDLHRRAGRWRRREADPLGTVSSPLRERFAASVRRVSATRLGVALACRHRHFLAYVVGVVQDEVPFDGPRFGAREEGTLLHEALRRALAEPSRTPEEISEAVLSEAGGKGPRGIRLPDEIQWDLTARELARVVALLRDREAGYGGFWKPLDGGLELAFGRDASLTLGEEETGFALEGRIDRIDARGRRAVVIDYKRSKDGVKRASAALDAGIDLQLPLYAAAVERLLGLEVVGFEWVAATARLRRGRWNGAVAELAEGRRENDPLPLLEPGVFRALLDEAITRAATVVAAVRAGDHTRQVEDAKRCGDCPWRTVCRPAFGSRSPIPDEGGTS